MRAPAPRPAAAPRPARRRAASTPRSGAQRPPPPLALARPLVKYQQTFNHKVVQLLDQGVPDPGYAADEPSTPKRKGGSGGDKQPSTPSGEAPGAAKADAPAPSPT